MDWQTFWDLYLQGLLVAVPVLILYRIILNPLLKSRKASGEDGYQLIYKTEREGSLDG